MEFVLIILGQIRIEMENICDDLKITRNITVLYSDNEILIFEQFKKCGFLEVTK